MEASERDPRQPQRAYCTRKALAASSSFDILAAEKIESCRSGATGEEPNSGGCPGCQSALSQPQRARRGCRFGRRRTSRGRAQGRQTRHDAPLGPHALAASTAAAGILPLPYQLGEHVDLRADAVGFTGGWGSVPEKERLKLRQKAGYTWTFPNEPENYKKRQEQRWVEIQALDHYQERLDNFVQYTQVRTVPNYTKNGFDVVDIPHDLWQRMRDRCTSNYRKLALKARSRGFMVVRDRGWSATGKAGIC